MKTNAFVKGAVIILTIVGSTGFLGTCTKTVYEPVPLDRPPRPELPTVSAHELECLSDAAFSALLDRERMRREYTEELEVIIDSTREQ